MVVVTNKLGDQCQPIARARQLLLISNDVVNENRVISTPSTGKAGNGRHWVFASIHFRCKRLRILAAGFLVWSLATAATG